MLTKEEQSNVEIEIIKLRMHMDSIGKELPSGKLIYDHTIIFFRKILGYHNAPIFFNPTPDRYASLLSMWQIYILNELSILNEDSFRKITKENNEIEPPSLNDLKLYIEDITKPANK